MTSKSTAALSVVRGQLVRMRTSDPWFSSAGVTVGVIDLPARLVFTRGQCHALALALNEATDWPIVWVGRKTCIREPSCLRRPMVPCPCQVGHFAVRLPDGRILDIDGARHETDVIGSVPLYEAIGTATPELMTCITAGRRWPKPKMEVAREFARTLLDELA